MGKRGALDAGSLMSPVDFKQRQCPLSLSLEFSRRFVNSSMSPVNFKKEQCPLSPVCRF